MSLLRQACVCVRSRPLAFRPLTTSAVLYNDNISGPSRPRRVSPNRPVDSSSGQDHRFNRDRNADFASGQNGNPNRRQNQRIPGTSRKHTPVEGFELPQSGPARETGGIRLTRHLLGNGSGNDGSRRGNGKGRGVEHRRGEALPRSDRGVRPGEAGREGTGFGLGSRKKRGSAGESGEFVRKRTVPMAPADGSNAADASTNPLDPDRTVSESPDDTPEAELDAFEISSRSMEEGRDRHGRPRGREPHARGSRGSFTGQEDRSRSSRSLLDRMDDDTEFVISRGGRDARGGHASGNDRSGRSHRLNARAAQQAILYGDRPKGKDRDRRDGAYVQSSRQGQGQGQETAQGSKNGQGGKVKRIEAKEERKVFIPSSVSVGRLADIFGVKIFNLQNAMRKLDLSEEQRRSDYLLTSEQACNIAIEYDLDPIVDDEAAFDIYPEHDDSSSTHPLRPPVVTIMGHVDHGKTTLLDSLRRTSVAKGEAGGITQHIGAFSVSLSDILSSASSSSASASAGGSADPDSPGSITFLDTPGHAAFTAMRARGASATDMVVLVVAADDGVMPQTKEVIELVRQEGDKVGLVVAINKCDKPGVDFAGIQPTINIQESTDIQDKVKSALGAEGVLLEEDGGETPSVRVSGLTGSGLDQLVETLSTLAEMRELRARKDGNAEGIVLESRVDRGRGNVATVLVQRGTLTSGTPIVAGTTWAKVRQMQDSSGRPLKSAGPGTPVSLTGWKDLPSAGDVLLQAPSEDDAKRAITNRLRDIERRKLLADVEMINEKRAAQRIRQEKDEERLKRMKEEGRSEAEVAAVLREIERRDAKGEQPVGGEGEGEDGDGEGVSNGEGRKVLNLVIKADVSGTVEAVVGSLEGIGNKEAGVKVVGTGVGEVGESDVHMAEATGAFSVPVPKTIESLATSLSVPLRSSKIIYELIERVRSDVAALLPPIKEIRVTGEATVQQIFEIKLKGKEVLKIAGSRVGNGVVEMKEGVRCRVLRGSERGVVYEGVISTLKHLKKDVTEVRKGTECGIGIEGFTDIREGDEIVTFTTVDVPRTL